MRKIENKVLSNAHAQFALSTSRNINITHYKLISKFADMAQLQTGNGTTPLLRKCN